MRVVIAPTAFKGTLTTREAALAGAFDRVLVVPPPGEDLSVGAAARLQAAARLLDLQGWIVR